jgi:hypothetical protein
MTLQNTLNAYFQSLIRSRDGVVATATGYGFDDRGVGV